MSTAFERDRRVGRAAAVARARRVRLRSRGGRSSTPSRVGAKRVANGTSGSATAGTLTGHNEVVATFDSVNPARPGGGAGHVHRGNRRRRRPRGRRSERRAARVGAAPDPGTRRAHRPRCRRASPTARVSSPTLVRREAGKVLVEAGGDVQEAIDMGRFVAGQGRAALGSVVAVRAVRTRWRGRRASRSGSSG